MALCYYEPLQINSFKNPIGTADIPAVDFNPLQEVDGFLSIEKCSIKKKQE